MSSELPSEKQQTGPDQPPCEHRKCRKFLKRWLPRTEVLILLAGLVCTVLGKLVIVQHENPANLFAELAHVVLPDILFFAVIFLIISCLYILKPSAFSARCALVIAALVSAWSVLNVGWLIKSGVQLQPGILIVLVRDLGELWPLVQTHLLRSFKQVIVLITMVVVVGTYFLWRLLRPDKVVSVRIHHARWATGVAVAIVVLLFAQLMVRSETSLGFTSEVLGFSSHWYALASTVTSSYNDQYSAVQTRDIPGVGQRRVAVPNCPSEQLPNVVLVLLESISHSVSLGNPEAGTMPNLARLAREGVEFRLTRVPVSHTTKAFWAALASTTPVIQTDYIEAVPVDEPYEGLPSILTRVGYRSGFFEMAKGSYECAPGFFSNFAFDWAWFRENLEDSSAHMGYMGGDDCRMIEPALEWVSKDSQPFFLMMITSVSHDPYEVPEWFERPKEKLYERYLQTVRYTDYFIGRLCQGLKEHGLEKNTILCVMGDHGTSFRVRAAKGRWVPYEEVIRVPWVIHWPGHIKAGDKIDWPCSQLDITPTILKLIGFDITEAGFKGKDAFTPSEDNRRLYFSSWHFNSPIGFIEQNRKVIYWPYLDKVFEYDLDADPGEENPRIISSDEMKEIKRDILDWQEKSQIVIDAKRYTERFLYSHWQTFSTGRSAWAYYVP